MKQFINMQKDVFIIIDEQTVITTEDGKQSLI